MSQNEWFIPETYEDFKLLAANNNLSVYEKIGFPEEYRKDFELSIFKDITSKLSKIGMQNVRVMDIGPGVSDLPHLLIKMIEANNSEIFLIDSDEMLNQLPFNKCVTKIPGRFPEVLTVSTSDIGKFDAILMYSVLQYVAFESSLLVCIDLVLDLLAPGGQMLIGDIPNLSMRNRFFRSENGIRFHQEFMKTSEKPAIDDFSYPKNSLDDSVIFSILHRARIRGFNAYCVPQSKSLPFANRREDILIERP
jgi:hypothetical protein